MTVLPSSYSSIIPVSSTVTFRDIAGKNFKWKGNGPGLSFEVSTEYFLCPLLKAILQLYSEEDKTNPIARFHRSRRILDKSTATQKWTPARLDLDSRADGMRDDVVVSFLFLEKGRRARENSTMLRADALGTPVGVAGGVVHKGGV